MPKTAQFIEEALAKLKPLKSQKRSDRPKRTQRHPNSLKNLRPWKPGQSGNPGGQPKHDVAREIARAIFTNNPEAIYAAMAKAILQGNAYSFDVVANRAFGKLTDKLEITDMGEVVKKLQEGRERLKKKQKA